MKGKQTPRLRKSPRYFYDFRKMKRFDGVVVPYGAIGVDWTLELFHNQAKCLCGDPEHCQCKLDVPIPPMNIKKRKDQKFFTDPKPMLLFTIRHRRNPALIYNFFTKDMAEALEEINRLNAKGKRTTDDGFYLDETDFDEIWNRPVVADYKAFSEYYND